MKALTGNEREKLLQYVEATEFGRDTLSHDERLEVEAWLAHREDARQEVKAIADHLRALQSLPSPEPPARLASQCLERMERGRQSRASNLFLKRASVMAVVMAIFGAGMWTGSAFFGSPDLSFPDLLNQQTALITQLETKLAERYQETSLTSGNPWYVPVNRLKHSTTILAAYYREHETDPVIESGLSTALAQNVKLLETLCQYVESNSEIPDLDILAFSTPDRSVKNAI